MLKGVSAAVTLFIEPPAEPLQLLRDFELWRSSPVSENHENGVVAEK